MKSLKLLVLSLLLIAAPAMAQTIEAQDGDTVRGSVIGRFTAQLEPGLREMGYVEYYVQEEGTGRIYSFMHEDPACVLLPPVLQYSGCSHSGPREVRLRNGDFVQLTQHQTYLTTRKTIEVEFRVTSRRRK